MLNISMFKGKSRCLGVAVLGKVQWNKWGGYLVESYFTKPRASAIFPTPIS